MARLKTKEQLEQERLDFVQRISGNYPLPTDRPALLYVRQSSIKQVRDNIYSGLQQTEDMKERALVLGWVEELCTIFVENQLTKDGRIRGVSGTIPIEDRPGLTTIIEHIKRGAGAILCVDVSRLTRDADLVDAATLAQTCKRYNAVIVTTEHVYDFRKDGEHELFMAEAAEAANYIKKQVGSKEYPNGKMYRGRTKKADKGKLANGTAPIGLMRDETGDNLKPSPHATCVDWLYGRFRALDANLVGLQREVVSMATRGVPLFPDHELIDPTTIFLTRMPGGWTIKSRNGLRHLLSNPAYQGHLVYNGRVVKRNAFAAIVDADNWQYAFEHLADVDLDGNPIEHGEKTVRYTQRNSTGNTALLSGTRDNGRPVVDGVNGAHIYVQLPYNSYVLRQRHGLTVTGYEARIDAKELDPLLVDMVLFWCRHCERRCEHVDCEQAPHLAMDTIEQATQPVETIEGDVLERAKKELARVQRALKVGQDVMSDEQLRENLKSEASLRIRIAKLEQAEKDADRRAREQEQAKDDINHACDRWGKWDLEKRRQFIRLITESITLEEIAPGWLRLVIVWSPLMGFFPPTSDKRAVDSLYLWRSSGSYWSEDELAILQERYPASSRNELLRLLPTRSWVAIIQKAAAKGIRRIAGSDKLDIPKEMSLSDVRVLKEFALQPGERVQWQHEHIHYELGNGVIPT